MKNKNIGGNFDDFLREENIYEEVNAAAIKRVVAYQIAQEMKRRKLTKTEMASRMKTSRAALERLLDPTNASVTLFTLERAASVLGKTLKIELA
ncbi:MAG: XRE family transcriptional regulator [Chloroflexi bacterium]|nr:XRE family transcriptional regulator [Chloroflexota bacterium]